MHTCLLRFGLICYLCSFFHRCINTQQFIDGLDSELPRLRTNSHKELIMPRSPMLLSTIHIADESCDDIGGYRRRKSLTSCRPLESLEQPSSSGKEDASKPSKFTGILSLSN